MLSQEKPNYYQLFNRKVQGYIKNNVISENSDSTMQLCLSITNRSIIDFENHFLNQNYIEHSIKDAYLEAIYSAEKFIHIENQFFSGPYIDKDGKMRHTSNTAIMAIGDKIIEQYNSGNDFSVIITLPYMPEGESGSLVVKSMLRKQWKTMRWLIEYINQHTNNNAHQYLTFANIGKT